MPKVKPKKSNKKPAIQEKSGKIVRDDKGRFIEGVSGNPDGRPAFSLLSILKAELQRCPEGQDKKTYADLIIKRMLADAIKKGDDAKIKLIWNYIEGMPPQDIKTTGELRIVEAPKEVIEKLNESNPKTK